MTTSRTSDHAEVELKDGYIHVLFKDMSVIGEEEAKIVADDIIDLCDGVSYPFITNGLGITVRMNKEARDLFASYRPLTKVRKGQAIIVNNTPSKLLANFYIKYHKPEKPTKIFTKFEEALEWTKKLA